MAVNAIHRRNRLGLRVQAIAVDPWVEQVAALLQASRMTDAAIAAKIGSARGFAMSPSAVANVRELSTTRPTNLTLDWLIWAVGKSRVLMDL